jgi:hypothetical protein
MKKTGDDVGANLYPELTDVSLPRGGTPSHHFHGNVLLAEAGERDVRVAGVRPAHLQRHTRRFRIFTGTVPLRPQDTETLSNSENLYKDIGIYVRYVYPKQYNSRQYDKKQHL